MKKETVEAFLETKNNEAIVIVEGKEGYTDPETLIAYLKKGVTSNQIKSCTPRQENGYTIYKFKVYNDEVTLNNYFEVKVRNNERYLFKPVIDAIKDISNQSNLIKKVNRNRLIAGIATSALIITLAGPTLVKGLGKLMEKEGDYDASRYAPYSQGTPSEEEIKQYEAEYYEDLRQRAESGDENALEEYNRYLLEQQLKDQVTKTR